MASLAEIDAELARRGVTPPPQPSLADIDAELARRAQADAGAREQINQAITSTPLGRGAAELGSALTRGATETVDFLTTQPINAALELAGREERVPTLTESLAPATQGNFLEPGLARDVIRTGGELVAPGGLIGKTGKIAASALPAVTAGEGVATGVVRQLGAQSVPSQAALSGVSGAGAEVGGEVGEQVAGEEGRVIGEQFGAILSPLSASIVKNTGSNFVTGSAKKLLKESAPTIDGLKGAARKVYKEIDDLGAVVNSARTDRLSNQLASSVQKEGFDATLHPKVAVALKRFADVQGQDLSVTEIDTLRKIANSAASSIEPDEKRLGVMLTRQVDDFLDNLKAKDFKSGGGDVGALYKDARQLWSRARKSELLGEAFTKAQNQASGFENGIRTQFRQILNNKKKRSGFTKEEIQAMQQVVRGGSLENTAKMIGRLGFSEGQASNMLLGSLGSGAGFALGGVGGGVAVPLIGQVSRNLAQKLTRNNAELADAIVRSGKSGSRLVNEYMNIVPRKQRDASELAQLLMRPDVSLNKLKASVAAAPKEQRQIISNAVFFAEALRNQAKEGDQSQDLPEQP